MTEAATYDIPLFQDVNFTVVQSDKISESKASEIIHLLVSNGAVYWQPLKNGDVDDLARHSHIISSHIDFPQYDEALEANCHVVKPSWVEQTIAKGRHAQERQHSPDSALIFQDVVVTFSGLPQGDQDAITAGVIAMGGMYNPSLTKLTTHIVTLTEDSVKVRTAREKRLAIKVVLPHWFDDCLRLGRMISEAPYMLPNPQILEPPSASHRINTTTTNADIADAKSAVAGSPPQLNTPPSTSIEPATPRKTLNVFRERKIFFCKDLDVNPKLAQVLVGLVESGGGSLTRDITMCDVFVGHYRDGDEYITASRDGKIVGNLPWFYSVVLRNKWQSPLRRLLHYPVPREGVPGFSSMKISLSNYAGDARLYLENLVKETGATFTKTLTQENTHLLTAHKSSVKCEAAQEWNINVVNHLWLEESYAKCRVQSVAAPRYIHFPSHTNLGECVGQTRVNLKRVEELYFGPQTKLGRDSESALIEPPLTRPSPRKTVRIIDAYDNNGRSPHLDRPDGSPEKENEVPTTARASKVRAAAELERAMEDIAAFERERKRKVDLTRGKKRASGVDVTDDHYAFSSDVDAGAQPRSAKKSKVRGEDDASERTQIKYKMLLTGDDRWAKKPAKENHDTKALLALGIQLVSNPLQCNLLCAPKILRTRKFVTAIAVCPEVVSTEFLDYALEHHELRSTSYYKLNDPDNEKKYGFDLAEARKRAAINKRKLLRGWTIYFTEKVNGGFDTFKDIVEANGGTAILYRGRAGVQLAPRKHLSSTDEADKIYLVSGMSDEDVRLWRGFRKLAEKQELTAQVVKTDWVLFLALAQQIEYDDKWMLDEASFPGAGAEAAS